MSGSLGAIVEKWMGCTAVPLSPSVLSGSCLYMLSETLFMCDLVLDVPNICIAYVTSVCYRISFTLIVVGWIFISVRLPPFLRRKKTTSRGVCINPAWLTNGTDLTEWNTPLDLPSSIFVLVTRSCLPSGNKVVGC